MGAGVTATVGDGTSVATGAGVAAVVGAGVAGAVGAGVSVAAGTGVAAAVGAGVSVAAGAGVSVAAGDGVSVAAGTGVAAAVGAGVAVAVGDGGSVVIGSSLETDTSSADACAGASKNSSPATEPSAVSLISVSCTRVTVSARTLLPFTPTSGTGTLTLNVIFNANKHAKIRFNFMDPSPCYERIWAAF